jgi:hypothetical protein
MSGNDSERPLRQGQRSQWRSIRVAAQTSSDHGPRLGKKIQKGGAGWQAAGRTNIASGLFANGRGQRKGGTGLGPLRVARADNSKSFETWQRFSVDIFGAHPPKVVETGYTVLASTVSGHGRPVRLQSWCRSGEALVSLPPPRTGFSQVTQGDDWYWCRVRRSGQSMRAEPLGSSGPQGGRRRFLVQGNNGVAPRASSGSVALSG